MKTPPPVIGAPQRGPLQPGRGGDRRLGSLSHACRKAVQEIHRTLRVRGGGEDRSLVLAEDLEPVRQVRGVVLARLRRDAEVRAQEGRAELGDELFAGVTVSPKRLLAKSRSRRLG